jgi:hypothetical protein
MHLILNLFLSEAENEKAVARNNLKCLAITNVKFEI